MFKASLGYLSPSQKAKYFKIETNKQKIKKKKKN